MFQNGMSGLLVPLKLERMLFCFLAFLCSYAFKDLRLLHRLYLGSFFSLFSHVQQEKSIPEIPVWNNGASIHGALKNCVYFQMVSE